MIKKYGIICVICIAGFLAGAGIRIALVSASDIQRSCPIDTEDSPSVVYDEKWEALKGLISTPNGVGEVSFSNELGASQTTVKIGNGPEVNIGSVVAGIMTTGDAVVAILPPPQNLQREEFTQRLFLPKLKVTRWQVRGHIHFTK